MENRNTILIDFRVEPADGYAERRAAITMLDENLPGSRRITVAGDAPHALSRPRAGGRCMPTW
jgi:hypothetical protein